MKILGLMFVACIVASCSGSESGQADPASSSAESSVASPSTSEIKAPETTDRKQVDVKAGGEALDRYEAYLEAVDSRLHLPDSQTAEVNSLLAAHSILVE